MKSYYHLDGMRVRACTIPIDLGPPGKTSGARVLLTAVEVATGLRGRRFGRRLMQMVLEDADSEGVVLMLSVEPDGSPGALGEAELIAWYLRLGFEFVSGGGCAMKRMPRDRSVVAVITDDC